MKVLPQWLRDHTGPSLRLDVIAGLSLAAFAIPESLAYASLAELPPISGLYCYLVAGIAYAIFGTSRQLAVGPTSALAIAVAASIAAMGGGDTARVVALGSGIALLVGLISVGGRYLGLANVAYFLPDTIITGFKTGAAIYIASTQLPKLFGIEGVSGSFFERVAHIATSLPQTHTPSLLVGVAAIVLFLVLERALPGRPTTLLVVAVAIVLLLVLGRAILGRPSTLMVIALAIVATKFLGLESFGILIVGELQSGRPAVGPAALTLADFVELIPTPLACFMLAYG